MTNTIYCKNGWLYYNDSVIKIDLIASVTIVSSNIIKIRLANCAGGSVEFDYNTHDEAKEVKDKMGRALLEYEEAKQPETPETLDIITD